MRVIRAEAMGMCFGVRDALAVARGLPRPTETTIYGELVHNEAVRRELGARGFRQVAEDARGRGLPTALVMITAHGVSDRERGELRARGHELIDTTCPLVEKAHAAARRFSDEGRHVVVLGRPGHVEVRGLVGDLRSWSVVAGPDEVATWPCARIGVVCQTTFPEAEARRLRDAIATANGHADVAFQDTVCEPTKQRMRAVKALARRVQAIVVVGGRNSNNTRQLVRACEAAGRSAFHVQGPDDLDFGALARFSVVGLTAGTSTQDGAIDAVERALRAVRTVRRRAGARDRRPRAGA